MRAGLEKYLFWARTARGGKEDEIAGESGMDGWMDGETVRPTLEVLRIREKLHELQLQEKACAVVSEDLV